LETTSATVLINGKAIPKWTKSEDLLDKIKPNRFWIKRQADEKEFILYISYMLTCEYLSGSNGYGYN
jgi:hypothetical protein